MITILTDKVVIKPHTAGKKHYESRGYLVKSTGIRGSYKSIEINVDDLMPNSNVYISYHCSACDSVQETRYCRIVNRKSGYCESCNRKYSNIGNTHGSSNKGKTVPSMQGPLHPRWNPNKTEQKLYYSKVMSLTRKSKNIYTKWENYDKIGLAGVHGAYQLDHIIPIKFGFDNKIDPSIIADISNLQLLPWKCNNQKRNNYSA